MWTMRSILIMLGLVNYKFTQYAALITKSTVIGSMQCI